jgi:hypothetical protein
MANVRIRGKIRHEEWPKIAARYRAGETMTEIARSYRCTAPAIRYIVKRLSTGAGKARRGDKEASGPAAVPIAQAWGSVARPSPIVRMGSFDQLQRSDLWARINTDIATYLTAMDAVAADDNEANYEALLLATDSLLRATARTRLELERVIASRRKVGQARRASG